MFLEPTKSVIHYVTLGHAVLPLLPWEYVVFGCLSIFVPFPVIALLPSCCFFAWCVLASSEAAALSSAITSD